MKLLTPEEVAAVLRLPTGAVLRGTLRRQLPWLKLAGKLRLTQEALEQFVTETTNSAQEEIELASKQQSQTSPRPYAPTPLETRSGRSRPRRPGPY